MCDNCKVGWNVIEKDYTSEAISIVEFVDEIVKSKSKLTIKMIIEMLKGRSVKSAYGISTELVNKFGG